MELVAQKLSLREDTQSYTTADIYNEIREDVNILVGLGFQIQRNTYSIRISNRAVTFFGRCRRNSYYNYTITISGKLLKNGPSWKVHNTIMHETIHSIPGCMNHSNAFLSIGKRVNQYYPSYGEIVRKTNLGEEYREKINADAKYILECPKCGKKYYYHRKPKYWSYYLQGVALCPECKAHLNAYLNPNL